MWYERIAQLIDMLFIWISGCIYDVIGFLYQIFMALASAQIFSSNQYQHIANNIYAVIGVVALFLISYALLRAIINPDGGGKSELSVSKLIPNVLKVIVLIAFVPTLFNLAYNVQNAVIATNLIPRIILGNDNYSTSGSGKTSDGIKFNFKTVGTQTANLMFKAFLYPSEGISEEEVEITDCYATSNSCPEQIKYNRESYSFKDASDDVEDIDNPIGFGVYLNFAGKIHGDDKQLEYNGIIQAIVGIFAIYVFFNYCIDIGVRAIKLGYYQVIAPIPILTLIVPGQNKVYQNWLKSTLSTFADVFIKILILFFGLLLIQNLPDFKNLWENSMFDVPSTAVINFSRVFLIIGILIFIKQAPKLVSDLFGISSGSFKLGIADKLKEMALVGDSASKAISGAQGAVTGALGAGWTSKMNGMGFKTGLKYGFYNGMQNGGNQFNAQRQQIYKKAFDGEGTAGLFGKRSYFSQTSADVSKATKNAYQEQNFRRLYDAEKSEDFQKLYAQSYQEQLDKKMQERDAVEKAYNDQLRYYTETIEDLNNQIKDAEKNQERLQTAQATYDRNVANFEMEKQQKREMLQMEYERATEKGDSVAQLAAATSLNALDSSKYSNVELESEIKNLTAQQADISSLKNQLNRVETSKENDSGIDEYKRQREQINNDISKLTEEMQYMLGDRSLKLENDFQFTDAVNNARAAYEKAHPEYHDIYDTYSKYRTENNVSKFMKSEEGQKSVAAYTKAFNNSDMSKPSGGSAAKSDKKS